MSGSLHAHQHLPPSTSRVYRLLGLVFSDTIDAGLTAAGCPLPAGQAARALQQLSSLRLLENFGCRRGRDMVYRFHTRARQHARCLASVDEPSGTEAVVTRRSLGWYGLLAEDSVFTALLAPRPGGRS